MNQPAGPVNGVQERVFQTEVLKQRHDVGERLMKRRRVGACWLGKVFPQPVD